VRAVPSAMCVNFQCAVTVRLFDVVQAVDATAAPSMAAKIRFFIRVS
jgi:hypothetical protein